MSAKPAARALRNAPTSFGDTLQDRSSGAWYPNMSSHGSIFQFGRDDSVYDDYSGFDNAVFGSEFDMLAPSPLDGELGLGYLLSPGPSATVF
jgi:hypothetical protein